MCVNYVHVTWLINMCNVVVIKSIWFRIFAVVLDELMYYIDEMFNVSGFFLFVACAMLLSFFFL